jgi:hypothetical protein
MPAEARGATGLSVSSHSCGLGRRQLPTLARVVQHVVAWLGAVAALGA